MMYLPSLLVSKMGRYLPEKPAPIPEIPADPRCTIQARPCRPAAPGAVRRMARRRAGKNDVVPPGFLWAAAMALSTFGCGLLSPEVEDTALVTDGTSFRLDTTSASGHLWYRGQVPYSFTNRTGSQVYLPNCRGGLDVRLEMEAADEWVGVWPLDLVICHDPPIVIEPDEVCQTTLHVACTSCSWLPPGMSPTASTRYRIMWGQALSSYDEDTYPFGELIPLEERVSNPFTFEVVPR